MVAEQLKALFDAEWYLRQYPDVADAGVDPWWHFSHHGWNENRMPCALPAFEWEAVLWHQPLQREQALATLTSLFTQPEVDHADIHRSLAGFVLARFYASEGEYALVADYIKPILCDVTARFLVPEQAPWLLCFSALYHQKQENQLLALLSDMAWPDGWERQLALGMAQGANQSWEALQRCWVNAGLSSASAPSGLPVDSSSDALRPPMKTQRVSTTLGWRRLLPWRYRVSVVIPCYNAAQTIGRALAGLCAQTWPFLEFVVVDDASRDNSVDVVKQWQARDARIRLVQQAKNQGAYAARNRGMQCAKGDWLTVHDADDWSHPQKIERQMQALLSDRHAVASVSHWIRCDEKLQFQRWRMEQGWVYRNVSSLLIKREVLNALGFWDNVAVNADTEYYYRLQHIYGSDAIVEVMPGIPLSLGMVLTESLTQQSATHLRTQFYGVRKEYHHSALAWHSTMQSQLPLPAEMTTRPFAVPPRLCKGSPALQQDNFVRYIREHQWVDEGWYRQRYPDVAAANIDAVEHYLTHGWQEGRDPCAHFSSSAYLYLHPDANAVNPLWHRLTHDPNTPPIPLSIPGQLDVAPSKSGRKTEHPAVVYVGHQVSNYQFGAERSFVQILQQVATHKDWQRQGYRIEVVLPSATDDYVEQILPFCHRVTFIPTPWWHQERSVLEESVNIWVDWLEYAHAKAVYVNTLVMEVPLLAAKRRHIHTAVHVRELPEHDPSLCAALGTSPGAWLYHFDPLVDTWIANSQAVAQWLTDVRKPIVWQNPWRAPTGNIVSIPNGSRLHVGMLSSNIAKKGIWDMLRIAEQAMLQQLPIDFYLYGPQTDDIVTMRADNVPSNLHFAGYVDNPDDALATLDVVLSLSHFYESFGRTVLEALSMGRVVIAYAQGGMVDWAADSPIIWAEYLDYTSVTEHLAALCADRQALQRRAQDSQQWVKQALPDSEGVENWLLICEQLVRQDGRVKSIESERC
ncbi:hypothetical protein BZG00_10725 [Salinivibrio kushneri]|uniref:Glycosyltransferase 2-like domain-containing protein n=1 Tax=Salinivibrio kushneri TaxID=1908198 RepID=A0AB36JXE9_9GAMM|nr:glycosyltransferase [Salinivibrio kushneri]OOE39352.1 hypothetical protein BZG00_10725 [Salinivibrio kushneri]QCP02414.1 glycosyltransferase [Salinivibrio kushneri]